MARPRKEINRDEFEKLCSIQATLNECCCYFDVSEDTIERWCKREYEKGFAEVFAEKRGLGTVSLRRKQFEKAMNGDKTMLIWLGKQLLGQADKQEQKIQSEQIVFIDDINSQE